jgi:hypothetical protein
LYLFRPPSELGADVFRNLHDCFARFLPFAFSLADIRRFPDVLYLMPEPDEPFRQLTKAICDRYPGNPPYGGKFADVIPHLTVAQIQSRQHLDRIADDFALAAKGALPVAARAAEVMLMDNRFGRWQIRNVFGLGGPTSA